MRRPRPRYVYTCASKGFRIRLKTIGRISRRSFPSHNWFSNTRDLWNINERGHCARAFPDYRARFSIISVRPLIFNRGWDHRVSEKRTRRKRFGKPQLIGRTSFHIRTRFLLRSTEDTRSVFIIARVHLVFYRRCKISFAILTWYIFFFCYSKPYINVGVRSNSRP